MGMLKKHGSIGVLDSTLMKFYMECYVYPQTELFSLNDSENTVNNHKDYALLSFFLSVGLHDA